MSKDDSAFATLVAILLLPIAVFARLPIWPEDEGIDDKALPSRLIAFIVDTVDRAKKL